MTAAGSIDLSAQGDLTISGDIVGGDKIVNQKQVARGQYVLQIGNVNGGVVNIQQGQPAIRPRPTPIYLRPRPFRNLIGREVELKIASDEARNLTPVEFYSEPGLGKTVLLRRLAQLEDTTPFPDGVIHLSALNRPFADFAQSLYDAFYESNPPLAVSEAEIQHGLQDKRALVLVDDVSFSRQEVETLLGYAPNCAFILASNERTLWGEGHAIALKGLSPQEAVQLIERELGRDLPEPEESVAAELAASVEGKPLSLLQIAALAREKGESLASVATRLAGATATAAVLSGLTSKEARVLAVLAPLKGTPVPAVHVAAITQIPDAAQVLESLTARGLVQRHSPRYSLRTPEIEKEIEQRPEAKGLTARALQYFIEWARQQHDADEVLEALEPMQALVGWASANGRPVEAVTLAKLIETPLILLGRWESWRQLLETALDSARAAGDRQSEGYFLHQLGSRALCRGEEALARELLDAALKVRQALGDTTALAVTQGNAQVAGLAGVPAAVTLPAAAAPMAAAPLIAPAITGAIITVTIVAALALPGAFTPFIAPTARLTPTIAESVTLPPSPTFTVAPTETLTPLASETPAVLATATTPATRTPSATATATASSTPSATPTRTATRRPSPTNTPTLTPTPTRAPLVISFTADALSVRPEECTTLRWSVENADQVFLYGGEYGGPPGFGVVGNDSRPACPLEAQTYTLRVFRDGKITERTVTVTIADVTPPPAPVLLSPIDRMYLPCAQLVTLTWAAVSDASGISRYEWGLEFAPDYESFEAFGSGATTDTSVTVPVPGCGGYRWRVRAVDGAGNVGAYAAPEEFEMD